MDAEKLRPYIDSKYAQLHDVKSDGQLREFVYQFKNQFMKKSDPLNKVVFDNKLHVIKNALGTHTYVKRLQGKKIKSQNQIRISSLFKQAPLALLEMIVVHELAHLKEKEHDKNFYKLCLHMLPDYHQLELDTRIYLILLESEKLKNN